jgi:excisionase family DNA binding protein
MNAYSPALQRKIAPSEREISDIKTLEQALNAELAHAKLIGANGEEIILPEFMYQLLRDLTHALATGHSVSIVQSEHLLTTQEAAEELNVSRGFINKLLKSNTIPHVLVGTHKRICFEDVMQYKKVRDAHRREGLKRLTQMSEELGLYEDDDFNPEDCS